jgi:hypothetical protein
VVADLRRDDLLLNVRKKLLPFRKCQTQVCDILKTIGSIEFHDVHADRWAIDPGLNQPQNPPHPRSLSRLLAWQIVSLSSAPPNL